MPTQNLSKTPLQRFNLLIDLGSVLWLNRINICWVCSCTCRLELWGKHPPLIWSYWWWVRSLQTLVACSMCQLRGVWNYSGYWGVHRPTPCGSSCYDLSNQFPHPSLWTEYSCPYHLGHSWFCRPGSYHLWGVCMKGSADWRWRRFS